MKRIPLIVSALALAAITPAFAQVANVKVVTDASPDYTDMPSLVHSITSKWDTPQEKCWALFYWNHIARRQTSPMNIRGVDLTDPIMQYNDYGFTMCSTVSGVNAAIWDFMGYKSRYWEIGVHTVSEVMYNDRYHLYDNSLSATYSLCDGKTIAGVEDIGAEGACAASGGVKELGHIAKYHCLNGTSANGFLEGADCSRTLDSEANSFHPRALKHQYFYKCAEWGHRYILNLREGEVYTRYYHRLDGKETPTSKKGKNGFIHDPAYYVPKMTDKGGHDPEAANPRYRIRGNGIRQWTPVLTSAGLPGEIYSSSGAHGTPEGVAPAEAGKAGTVVFKVEGANVMTSMKLRAVLVRMGADDQASIALSADEGRTWKDIFVPDAKAFGELPADVKLLEDVNGSHSVLVKVQLLGKNKAADAVLKSIAFETITQLDSKTQPKLNIGKNTIFVGTGEQTETIVFNPDLRKGQYEKYAVTLNNLTSVASPDYGRYAQLYIEDAAVPKGWADFKVDAPTDITSFTFGGRMTIRAPKSSVELSYSYDDGKKWTLVKEYATTEAPWDQTHYHTITDVPAGTRSVMFRYRLNSHEGTPAMCGLYSVRMEVQHKLADPAFKPMDVTFNWKERQKDYSLVERSHTQLIEKVPATYSINVGGADHPVMDSLTVNLKGSRQDVKYGYSDGKDVGSEKFVGTWATYGKNLALGKSYTLSVPSLTNWEAGDPELKKLTDGRVGASYGGGTAYREGPIWNANKEPEIVVDLGSTQKCAAFRIHTHGYEGMDAIKGQNKDQVEVLTSNDGKEFASAGFFDFNLRWKDIPANYMWTDEETFCGHNFFMAPKAPVEARYVKYKLKSPRMLAVSEVQVLESYEFKPFDLKIALPKDASKAK